MPNVVAFFPWACVQAPASMGALRLLPYETGRLPGDLPFASQADIDGVLSAYADRPNVPVERCTILEVGDWQSGMDVSDEQVGQLFRARHFLAFSALSQRTLFHSHFGYVNFDTYALTIQRYQPGESSTFAFTARRRDGHAQHLWGSDEFAFHRPLHVDSGAQISLDEALLTALLRLEGKHERLYEAIVEFNQANTDSSDVPSHVEVVMCKSAFEWLLEINPKADSFVAALGKRLAGIEFLEADGPLVGKWLDRYQHESRLLNAWARDFCAVRGKSAHGSDKRAFVWSNQQHLAFISVLFPLMVKKVLSDEGLLTMDEFDIERLRRIENYLANDPFDFDWDSDETHPWSEISSKARMTVLAKRLYPDWN